jgi:leucyl aminopeptidase
MEFAIADSLKARKNADLLVLPFWQKKEHAEAAAELGPLKSHLKLALHDFKGKEGEVLFLYVDEKHENRLALLGLGDQDKLSIERLRRSYAALAKACQSKKIETINILFPEASVENLAKGIAEGLLLANYAFTTHKHEANKKNPVVLLKKATFIGADKKALAQAKQCQVISEGVYLARDLVNENADEVTPQRLGKVAQEMAKKLPHLKATVFDKKRIQKEKMGLLLAVNRGSANDPAFIILEYKGAPKSKDTTVLVGKGITYDTGGLNLKPTGGMETMKCDMGGAAVVLGTIQAAAKLGLKCNLVGIIPSTENSISGTSYKPGDVYTSYSGKSVEIGNTDAEGRLVLADALAYAVKHYKPTRIIDFATLTGAIEIALGNETSGLMSNNDALADLLLTAGSNTYERAWRLPIFEEYRDQLKSDIADIKNIGGRPAGSITAALFLKEFVEDTPWAHFDIAGTAYLNEARRYHPKHATGIGVRLMVDFLENLI